MCGRFTLRTPLTTLAEQFHLNLENAPQLSLRYNIAPTQDVAAVRLVDGKRQLAMLRWGLIPSWAKDTKIASSTINARGDTVATKPAFRAAYKRRRCLVLADGYYEWIRVSSRTCTKWTAASPSRWPGSGSSGGEPATRTGRRWRRARSSRPTRTSWPRKSTTVCR